jgi:Flp pilus assembly protein TadG
MTNSSSTQRRDQSGESGFVLIWAAVFMTLLLVAVGLALDTARSYVVKAQLTKATDGAALAAARMLNSGNPRGEAARIFNANFPHDFMGASFVTDPTADPDFFHVDTDLDTGINVITVTATAVLPTTFMQLADREEVTVRSSAETNRKMVDLSLVLDVSGSLGDDWPTIRDAAREFVDGFDEEGDRLALITFSDSARVREPMTINRGFDKDDVTAAIPNNLPGGFTNMAEGIYRGWDELRSVPAGRQSSIRVIVLFTDGSANGVSGLYTVRGTPQANAKSLHTDDFGQGANTTTITGLYDTETGNRSPSYNTRVNWNSRSTVPDIPLLPDASAHTHSRSSGIPNAFPFQVDGLMVDGVPQSTARGLRDFDAMRGVYPAQAYNINNAARNLVEIVSNAARSDFDGDYPIRIYAIGMGPLMREFLGTRRETSESILRRVANDYDSMDFNPDQLEGRYYFAQSADDVQPAFQQLQSQIIRLTR